MLEQEVADEVAFVTNVAALSPAAVPHARRVARRRLFLHRRRFEAVLVASASHRDAGSSHSADAFKRQISLGHCGRGLRLLRDRDCRPPYKADRRAACLRIPPSANRPVGRHGSIRGLSSTA